MEKMFRVNKPMYIAYIDLENVFDNIIWEILFNIMKTINIELEQKLFISYICVILKSCDN